MTGHDGYWQKVKEESAQAIASLFASCDVPLKSVVRHTGGIESREDVEAALAYLLKHGNVHEAACGILACGDWLQAENELAEGLVTAGAVAR